MQPSEHSISTPPGTAPLPPRDWRFALGSAATAVAIAWVVALTATIFIDVDNLDGTWDGFCDAAAGTLTLAFVVLWLADRRERLLLYLHNRNDERAKVRHTQMLSTVGAFEDRLTCMKSQLSILLRDTDTASGQREDLLKLFDRLSRAAPDVQRSLDDLASRVSGRLDEIEDRTVVLVARGRASVEEALKSMEERMTTVSSQHSRAVLDAIIADGPQPISLDRRRSSGRS